MYFVPNWNIHVIYRFYFFAFCIQPVRRSCFCLLCLFLGFPVYDNKTSRGVHSRKVLSNIWLVWSTVSRIVLFIYLFLFCFYFQKRWWFFNVRWNIENVTKNEWLITDQNEIGYYMGPEWKLFEKRYNNYCCPSEEQKDKSKKKSVENWLNHSRSQWIKLEI